MKALLIISVFFMSSLVICQTKVTKESELVDPAYKRAFDQVQKLDKEISAAWKKIEATRLNHSNNKEDIKKFISHNLKIKGQLESSGIDTKCKKINALWSKFKNSGRSKRYCNSVAGRIKSIDDRVARARKKLNLIQVDSDFKKDQKVLDELNKDKIKKLDKEGKSLDEQLKRSEERLKQRKKKKHLSLNEFVKTKSKKSPKTKNLSDFLTKGSSKSLKGGTSSKKTKSLADQLGGFDTKDDSENSAKIKTSNGLTGVVDSKGKVLISFKKWRVNQYKMGIAEVVLPVYSRTICNNKITTHKKGFVDSSGQFIDGFEIEISQRYVGPYKEPTMLILYAKEVYQWDSRLTVQQNYAKRDALERKQERAKRERERKSALKKRENELKEKKCRLQINQYKQSEYSKY